MSNKDSKFNPRELRDRFATSLWDKIVIAGVRGLVCLTYLEDCRMLKPKPCPYCGGKTQIDPGIGGREYTGLWKICCSDVRSCGVEGPMRRSKHKAILQWNRMEVKP